LNNRATSQIPTLTTKEQRMVLCASTLTPQSSVEVTYYILTAPHFAYTGGMETRVKLVAFRL